MVKKRLSTFFLALVFTVASITSVFSTQANAADLTQFRAGNIISDEIFTNTTSMTVSEIQDFLNSKVNSCDNYGTKTSELGGGTRRQWMANRGIQPPFKCVTDYYENPVTGENNYGRTDIPTGAISAAQIIYNYSQQFGINPQVIIVTLQKENGLITDQWPTPRQFYEAMGFGCPDNVAPGAPACNPQYRNFSTQVYQAARHFRGYMDRQYCNGTWCTPYVVGVNYIRWSTNAACGGTNVNIENKATSALYSYTPYQPNEASLRAGYGTGDGCSQYGNRNFFSYYHDWFGGFNSCAKPLAQVQRLYNPSTYGQFYSTDRCEITNLTKSYGWQLVGPAYNLTTNPDAALPVYRLYNSKTGRHFWTTSIAESNSVQQSLGYHYEGIAFYTVNPAVVSQHPVYRLYNPKTGVHFWTLTWAEVLSATNGAGFNYEGTAFYSQ